MRTLKLSNLTMAISLLICAQAASATASGPIYGAFDSTDGINQPIQASTTAGVERHSIHAESIGSGSSTVYGAFQKRPEGNILPLQAGYGPAAQTVHATPVAATATPVIRFGTFVHSVGITLPAGQPGDLGADRPIDKALAQVAPAD